MEIETTWGEVFEFPDGTPDEVIKKTVRRYAPASTLDVVTGVARGIPVRMRAGITATAGALAGPSDLDVLDKFDMRPEDKEVVAQRWFGKSLQQLQSERDTGADPRSSALDLARNYTKEAESYMPRNQNLLQEAVGSAFGSVVTNVPVLATAAVLKSPAAAVTAMSALSGSQSLAEGVTKGVPVEEAMPTAVAVGATEGVLELAPTKLALQFLDGKNLFKKALKYVAAEELTELPTTAIQNTLEWRGYDPKQSFDEFSKQLRHDLLVTAIATPMSAGGTAGSMRAIGALEQKLSGKSNEAVTDEALLAVQKAVADLRSAEELNQMGQKVDLKPLQDDLQRKLGAFAGEEIGGGLGQSPSGLPPVPDVPLPPTNPFQPENPLVIKTSVMTPEKQALIDKVDAALGDAVPTPEEAAGARAAIQAFEAEKAAPAKPETVAFLAGIDSLDEQKEAGSNELPATTFVTKNAANYANNPNNETPRSQRLVTYSSNKKALGLRLDQSDIDASPGTYVIGEPTSDRPAAFLEALMETVEPWRQKYLPGRSLILSNEALQRHNAMGWHYQLDSGTHLIVPGFMRKVKPGEPFNANATLSPFMNLAHEFGHAVLIDRFFGNVSPAVANQVRREAQAGVVSEEALALLSPEQAGVVREFNELKQKVLSGDINYLDFLRAWHHPGKVLREPTELKQAKANAATPALEGLRYRFHKSFRDANNGETPHPDFIEAQIAEYLNFDEYAAEQMVRYAYERGWAEQSAFNKIPMYARAFQQARDMLLSLFKMLKNDKVLAPGVKFADWLDGLTSTPGVDVKPGAAVKEKVAKAAKKPKADPAKPAKKATKKPAEKKLDINVETKSEQAVARKQAALSHLAALIKSGDVTPNSDFHKELKGLIKAEQWEEFRTAITPYVEKKIRWAIDPDMPVGTKITEKGGMDVDLVAVYRLEGLAAYRYDAPGVIIREAVQNAFDAIKTMQAKDPSFKGVINIETDPVNRVIRVTDNGVGMTPDVLKEALMTYPGTSKVGLPIHMRSGGLGKAKILLLFLPLEISVTTISNGIQTTIVTKPQEIAAKKTDIVQEIVGKDTPSGTVIELKLPEVVERSSGDEVVDINAWYGHYDTLYYGIVRDNLEVTYNGRSIPTTIPPEYSTKVSREFSWGKATAYINPQEDTSLATIYSAGLFQFHTTPMVMGNRVPVVARINFEPKVEGQDPKYPFTITRDGLKEHALVDMSRLFFDIYMEYARKRAQENAAVYANVKVFPSDLSGEIELGTPAPTMEMSPSGDELLGMNLNIPSDFAIYHNSTNKDFTNTPAKRRLLARLANIMNKVGRAAKKEIDKHVERAPGFKNDKPLYFGISIRKDKPGSILFGVNTLYPYQAVFVNPFASMPYIDSIDGFATQIMQTWEHEIAHIYERDHNTRFAGAQNEIAAILANAGIEQRMRAVLTAIVREHYSLIKELTNEYAAADTLNVGKTIEGVSKSFSSADGVRYALEDRAKRGAGKQRLRRGAPGRNRKGGIHYEVDIDGEPVGVALDHIGSPEFGGRQLTEAEALSPANRKLAAETWAKYGVLNNPYVESFLGTPNRGDDPTKSTKVVTSYNTPLRLFHASAALIETPEGLLPFVEFQKRDIGYHFGSPLAAYTRTLVKHTGMSTFGLQLLDSFDFDFMKEIKGEVREKAVTSWEGELRKEMQKDPNYRLPPMYLIPVYLNIRTPLYLDEEIPSFWDSAEVAANILYDMRAITQAQYRRLIQTARRRSQPDDMMPKVKVEQEAVREVLIEQGFDGIHYINTVEGDQSWVAFHTEQVKSELGNKTFSKSRNINYEIDFDEATPEGSNASRLFRKLKPFLKAPGPVKRALSRVSRLGPMFLQLQQYAKLHPEIEQLAFMSETNLHYGLYKGRLQQKADENVFQLEDLSKESFAKVTKFLNAEFDSGALWVELVRKAQPDRPSLMLYDFEPNETFYKKLKEYGIDPQTSEGEELAKLILEIKRSMLEHVNNTYLVIETLISRRFGHSEELLVQALKALRSDIHAIASQPFIPRGRFGNLVITIEKKRTEGIGWEVVHREQFENEQEWRAAAKRIEANLRPDERMQVKELKDTEYVLMSLPLDFVDMAAKELELSPEQVDTLLQILQPVRKDKMLSQYDLKRLKVGGASNDFVRSYSNFMWHNANLLAKLRYRADFTLAIQGVASRLREASRLGPDYLNEVIKLTRIRNFMQRTRDYVMAPPNEAHMARAVVSLTYLSFNLKTAVMNLYGLVTTWSHLVSELGVVEAHKVFARATQGAWDSVLLTNLNAVQEGIYLKPEWKIALDQAVKEGVLTQSYAYHLAGAANAPNLSRLPWQRQLGKFGRKTIDVGMYGFRLTELGARRVTFLATLEVELRKKGQSFTESYTNAVARTNELQNEYSLGNRPEFMRGISTKYGNKAAEALVPMATIFMSFAQHMAFHVYGGYEVGQWRKYAVDLQNGVKGVKAPPHPVFGYTMRIWLLTLFLAGYEGLPGMENMLDLLNILWKWLFKTDVRQDLREFVQAVTTLSPDEASRGFGHNIFGFDVSRSLGLGRFVPGTDALSQSNLDVARTTGTMIWDLLGPAGNMAEWMLKTAFDDKPLSEGLKRTPGAIGNVLTAYSWARDGVRAPSQALITYDLETGKLRDLTTVEVYGKALGFNPTVVSQNREILFAQHDARMYWQARRARLLDDAFTAYRKKDREAIADTRKAVDKFNEGIPEAFRAQLRIKPTELVESRQTRMKSLRLEEKQQPPSKRYRKLYQEIRESFEEPE